MKAAYRVPLLVLVLGLAAFAGWRIVGAMQAERHAAGSPEQALRWRPDDPRALLAQAQAQLRDGDVAGAEATARRTLALEPLQGEAFVILAEAAARREDGAQALRLYRIAAARAPRDVSAAAWLTRHFLEQGDFGQALTQIDRILRTAPRRAHSILPLLVQLAERPDFADALAQVLRTDPPWRAGLLRALRDPKSGNPVATSRVMQALQEQGGLSGEEYAQWLDSLIAQGRWGQAYARWAGGVVGDAQRLPLVYNGDFAQEPSDVGFDWRRRRVPGVLLRFEQVAGTQGRAAYMRFMNRRVPNAGLEQPLKLAPGNYRLRLRMRAQALRSELGLQWRIACAGPAGIVARSEPVDGSFAWRETEIEFPIPQQGCPGQWLGLFNPVASGAGQRVSGEIWVDDIAITRP